MCIFIGLGSHLLVFIRHCMKSCLPLGLRLLEGRNTLPVPQDVPLFVPRATTSSLWVNFYTPILHQALLRATVPGILCLCLLGAGQTDVLGCTHCPCAGNPSGDVPAHTQPRLHTKQSAKRGPTSNLDHRATTLRPSCPCPAPLHFSLHLHCGMMSLQTGQSPTNWLVSTQAGI